MNRRAKIEKRHCIGKLMMCELWVPCRCAHSCVENGWFISVSIFELYQCEIGPVSGGIDRSTGVEVTLPVLSFWNKLLLLKISVLQICKFRFFQYKFEDNYCFVVIFVNTIKFEFGKSGTQKYRGLSCLFKNR